MPMTQSRSKRNHIEGMGGSVTWARFAGASRQNQKWRRSVASFSKRAGWATFHPRPRNYQRLIRARRSKPSGKQDLKRRTRQEMEPYESKTKSRPLMPQCGSSDSGRRDNPTANAGATWRWSNLSVALPVAPQTSKSRAASANHRSRHRSSQRKLRPDARDQRAYTQPRHEISCSAEESPWMRWKRRVRIEKCAPIPWPESAADSIGQ